MGGSYIFHSLSQKRNLLIMSKAIALIDCNNFYASCEQSIDPKIAGKAVVVLSNNDGCIIARSSEARALGISMGTPYFKVKDRLKELGVIVKSSNYELYGDLSERLMEIVKSYSNSIEIYSIDEAFIKLERGVNNDIRTWACNLRASIQQNLGLTISIGIGVNKSQSKIANLIAKNNHAYAGIFDFTGISKQDIWLEKIRVEDVWGIGGKLSKRCRLCNIKTALELRDACSYKVKKELGVIGLRLQNELRGQMCLPLKVTISPKKDTCISRSFNKPITDLKELRQAIGTYVVKASEKLRKQRQVANSITIFLRTSNFTEPFYSESATEKLNVSTNETGILMKTAMTLTEKIFIQNTPFKKAGVIMQDLQTSEYIQLDLLHQISPQSMEKKARLMQTIDQLNNRFGRGSVDWCICNIDSKLEIRREYPNRYSTLKVLELPIVKT